MDRDTRDMLLETADRFFTQRCGREVERVPSAGAADPSVTVVSGALAVVAKTNAKVGTKPSNAGQPYGAVTFDKAAAESSAASPVSAERAFQLAAVMRAMQMAG